MNQNIDKEFSFDFEGIGIAITSDDEFEDVPTTNSYTYEFELYVDGKLESTSKFPINYTIRRNTAFWKYQLPNGKHDVTIKILNPTENAELLILDVVIYSDKHSNPKY
jgi:hypothetical protein